MVTKVAVRGIERRRISRRETETQHERNLLVVVVYWVIFVRMCGNGGSKHATTSVRQTETELLRRGMTYMIHEERIIRLVSISSFSRHRDLWTLGMVRVLI